jgi:hypothetical protein
MLLRLLGEALTRSHRLPAAEGLTATAIAERARLDSVDEREELRRVGATAEAVRYAAATPPDETIEGTVERGEGLAREIRAAGTALMRERGIAFLLALAALAAFYGLWLRPAPSLDPDANIARPTTAERRGNGYAGLYEWLPGSGVEVRSLRDRYTTLPELEIPTRGNLLVLSLPAVEVFHSDELSALDKWVRRGKHAAHQCRAARSAGLGGAAVVGRGRRDRVPDGHRIRDAQGTRGPPRRHTAGAARARGRRAQGQAEGR